MDERPAYQTFFGRKRMKGELPYLHILLFTFLHALHLHLHKTSSLAFSRRLSTDFFTEHPYHKLEQFAFVIFEGEI